MLADDLSKIASTKRKVIEHNFYVANVDNFEKLSYFLKEVASKGLTSVEIKLGFDEEYTDIHITDNNIWKLSRPLIKWISNNHSMVQRVTGLKIDFPMTLPTEQRHFEERMVIYF